MFRCLYRSCIRSVAMFASRKDLAAGLVFVSIGVFFFVHSIRTLSLGTASEMGPGYYPTMLSAALVGLGVLICVGGKRSSAISPPPWRSIILLGIAPLAFAAAVRFGFVAAVGTTGLISAFAAKDQGWMRPLVMTIVITAFSVLVFSYGLGISIPLLRYE